MAILVGATISAGAEGDSTRRVPAEWEPQEAVWMQWPGPYEKSYEKAFARIASVISGYETLHILHSGPSILESAKRVITREGGNPDHPNIAWHAVASDSAWMRDNGPVWVIDNGTLLIQDWTFDAWGGAFGSQIPYALDDRIPIEVARIAGLPHESVAIVHERGNLEFNGRDTVMLNWSVIGDPRRNADYTREKAEADLKAHFGVSKVVFIEGVPDGDLTNGHIDGIARFIDHDTVVVARCTDNAGCPATTSEVFENAAETIAAAGLTVIRDPVDTAVVHRGMTFRTNYMNWLVGNGFVITTGFGHTEADEAARQRLETYFPGRDVYVIEMLDSWAAGGGVHCHTNDQPALPDS